MSEKRKGSVRTSIVTSEPPEITDEWIAGADLGGISRRGGAGFTVLSASIRRSAGVHCATTLKNRQHLWHLSYFWADLRLTT